MHTTSIMYQELEEFITSLLKHNRTSAVVVEGKKDKKAVEELGCKQVYCIDTHLYLLAEKVSLKHKKVIILTDLDAEGKKLHALLKSHFAQLGVHVVEEPREHLFETTIRQVEGLTTHLKRQSLLK